MISGREALERLKDGNQRFASNVVSLTSLTSQTRRVELAAGQEPFAIILGCSDSRVPAEIVFDQGLGDLFVIRVAGNIVAPSQVGSVEFAAERYGTRLVVVLGHSQCGAILATLEELQRPTENQSRNLRSIVDRVRPSVEALLATELRHDLDALVGRAVRANIRASANHLRHGSAVLEQLIQDDGPARRGRGVLARDGAGGLLRRRAAERLTPALRPASAARACRGRRVRRPRGTGLQSSRDFDRFVQRRVFIEAGTTRKGTSRTSAAGVAPSDRCSPTGSRSGRDAGGSTWRAAPARCSRPCTIAADRRRWPASIDRRAHRDYARRRLPPAAARLHLGDAERLPFRSGVFDVVVSGLALNFMDAPAALAEQRRVAACGASSAPTCGTMPAATSSSCRFWDAAGVVDAEATRHDPGRRFSICNAVVLAGLFRGLAFTTSTRARSRGSRNSRPSTRTGARSTCARARSRSIWRARRRQRDRVRQRLKSTTPAAAGGIIRLKLRAFAVRGLASPVPPTRRTSTAGQSACSTSARRFAESTTRLIRRR